MKKQIRVDNSKFTSGLQGSKGRPDDIEALNEITPVEGATTDYVPPKKKEKPTITKQASAPLVDEDLAAQKDIAFFLRIHGHLPDRKCGGGAFGPCYYMKDLEAINSLNEHEEDLIERPEYPAKKAELLRKVEEYHAQ